MKFKRLLSLILCLLLFLSGCSRSSNDFVGYDISTGTNNLDPQFYKDKIAQMLIINIFEGLVVKDSSGKIHSGVAEEWNISDNQLIYTFKLRDNVKWNSFEKTSSQSVTAHDFKFAFNRLFNYDAKSPHAAEYLAIKNANDILLGTESIQNLGVRAISDTELIVELEYPDPLFLEKLSDPPAMPCNEEFFLFTKGRYGLEESLILGNGPFKLTRWEKDNRITLSKNIDYQGESSVKLENIDFYIGREDRLKRFKDKKTHIVKLSENQLSLVPKGYTIKSYDEAVWCIGFNGRSNYWGVPLFRQAVAYSTDRSKIAGSTNSIFSNNILVGDTPINIKEDPEKGLEYNRKKAYDCYQFGLSVLGIDRIPNASIIVPEGIDEDNLRELQNSWKESLSLYINLNVVPHEELDLIIRAKEYEIVLMPIKARSSDPEGVLKQFLYDSKYNYTNYSNPVYDDLVEDLKNTKTLEQIAKKSLEAEQFLLSDSIVIPLYTEQAYYAVAKFADEVDIYPLDEIIRFHSAKTTVK